MSGGSCSGSYSYVNGGSCIGTYESWFSGTCQGTYESQWDGKCTGMWSDWTSGGGRCEGTIPGLSVGSVEASLALSMTLRTSGSWAVTGVATLTFTWASAVASLLGVSTSSLSAGVTVTNSYVRIHFDLPQIDIGLVDVTARLGHICYQLHYGSGMPKFEECTGTNEAYAHLLDAEGRLPRVPEGHVELDLAKLDPKFAHLSLAELTDPSHPNFDRRRLPTPEGHMWLRQGPIHLHDDRKGLHKAGPLQPVEQPAPLQ